MRFRYLARNSKNDRFHDRLMQPQHQQVRHRCELSKLIIRHNIVPISAANTRLLSLGQRRRMCRSSAGPTTAAFVDFLNWPTFSRNLVQYRPVAVPKKSVGGQSLGQNWPPSAYRSYHSINGTVLETDLRQHFFRCWASLRPYLTSLLGWHFSYAEHGKLIIEVGIGILALSRHGPKIIFLARVSKKIIFFQSHFYTFVQKIKMCSNLDTRFWNISTERLDSIREENWIQKPTF